MLSSLLPLLVGRVEKPPGCSTWKEGRHCGNNLDRGCVGVVDVDKGSLIVAVADMVGVTSTMDSVLASDMIVVLLIALEPEAMIVNQRD